MEPNERIPSFGDWRDSGTIRMGILGGRWFGRRRIGCGALIGTHDSESNHHGLLYGALFVWGSDRNTAGDFLADIGPTNPSDCLGDIRVFDSPFRTGFGHGIYKTGYRITGK